MRQTQKLSVRIRFNKLVIGIGNAYRGDDGVGVAVARHLKERAPRDLEILEATGECTFLMEYWKDAKVVILVDALQSGARPGTVFRFCTPSQPFPTRFSRHSTHALGIGAAIELARAMNRLPPCLIIYGIEGKNFQAGFGLSPEVAAAVGKVGDCILEDIRSDLQHDLTHQAFESVSR
jgi:hydrogenase maturation protease